MATEQTHDAAHESHGDHGCGCGPNHEAQAETVGDSCSTHTAVSYTHLTLPTSDLV